MSTIAFIDIGTNSVRMLIVEIDRVNKPRVIAKYGKITKLGEGLINSGTISNLAIERSISVIEGFEYICQKHECNEIIAFSTSVLRKAVNAHDFTSSLKARTGIEVEIISGEKEASLILSGVKDDFPGQNPLVVDIGGGSTEISFEDEYSNISLKSFDIGALSLSEAYSLNEKIIQRRIDEARNYADKIFEGQFPEISRNYIHVGTGGTITSLAAIKLGLQKFEPQRIHKTNLSKIVIEEIFNKLSRMNQDEIRNIPTLEKGREDTILGGLIILLSVLANSGSDSITVCTNSILWGMVVEYQKKFFLDILK
jgi:exopolyphosphatase / guanosine-5'-triphosphate,3'-diphosphate pyrophosphatase